MAVARSAHLEEKNQEFLGFLPVLPVIRCCRRIYSGQQFQWHCAEELLEGLRNLFLRWHRHHEKLVEVEGVQSLQSTSPRSVYQILSKACLCFPATLNFESASLSAVLGSRCTSASSGRGLRVYCQDRGVSSECRCPTEWWRACAPSVSRDVRALAVIGVSN